MEQIATGVSPEIKLSNQDSIINLPVLSNTPENFQEGKTAHHLSNWRRLTTNRWISKTISGLTIEFHDCPIQCRVPNQIHFTVWEITKIDSEISLFVSKNIIEQHKSYSEGFLSNFFTREKKDGTLRVILNLKTLNKFVENYHFKIDTLKSAINLMTPIVILDP